MAAAPANSDADNPPAEHASTPTTAAEAAASAREAAAAPRAGLADTRRVVREPVADGDVLRGGVSIPAFPHAAMLAAIELRLKHNMEGAGIHGPFEPMVEWDLVTKGQLADTDLMQAYHVASGLPVIDEVEFERLQRFPGVRSEYLAEWLCLPLLWDDRSVALVVATPYHLGELAAHWQRLMGRSVRFYLGRRSLIERLITANYERHDDPADDPATALGDASEAALRDLASEAPIVRLVQDMFARAIELNASDIHVEPGETELVIRFRVDGILRVVMTPPIASYAAIASRLKLVGGLNIAERRLPQDGRANEQIGRAQLDIRISTVPALHGESIVLRLLRKDQARFSLESIGMNADLRARFTALIGAPYGMILVVGPTGSGKTTTLYSAMKLLNSDEKKIITIEDPIEYQLDGVTQIQVKPAIGLTFANGLRSIVRQDPDIILVGEIRDRETAEIAIHAALTGHLVLSTLHTNDAVGAISRLIDMGVEDFLISSALIGVMSQRLVRQICPACRGASVTPDAAAGAALSARACRTCSGTGFSDRVGIFEFLRVDANIRKALREGADSAALNAVATAQGMRSLREDGDAKVLAGVTTAEEVARVCRLDF